MSRSPTRLLVAAIIVALLLSPIAILAISDWRDFSVATRRWRGFDGDVSGYNMCISWRGSFRDSSSRAVIYPCFLTPGPAPYRDYGDHYEYRDMGEGIVRNPLRVTWQDATPSCGGSQIDFPIEKDTAVIAPDGSITFIHLRPDYVNYGPAQTLRLWRIFERRMQLPDVQHPLNVGKLEAAGLLPSWARFASERPASAVPAPTSNSANTTQAP